MSKNITIQEGGMAKSLTVDKLKTYLVGGGSCLWIPEDERQLTTKYISKNGTYKASDDGYYGYSEVTVSGVGTASGKDPDGSGDDAAAYTDPETGDLVIAKLPSSIVVTTPPTNPYGIYTDGQSISTDGMVVKAYLESGAEYGTVPNSEITINPTVAIYDASTDRSEYTGDGIDAIRIRSSTTPIDPEAVNLSYELFGIPDGVSNMPGLDFYVTIYGTQSYIASDNVFSATVAIKSSAARIVSSGNGRFSLSTDAQFWKGAVPESSTDPTNKSIDDLEPAGTGSRQTITVSWPRPHDGKLLETTFEILVAPGYTPNSGE